MTREPDRFAQHRLARLGPTEGSNDRRVELTQPLGSCCFDTPQEPLSDGVIRSVEILSADWPSPYLLELLSDGLRRPWLPVSSLLDEERVQLWILGRVVVHRIDHLSGRKVSSSE
jgi:hypothetical protein